MLSSALPRHLLARTTKLQRCVFVVRQAVLYRTCGILTLNMKFRFEASLGQEIGVYGPKRKARHFGKQVSPAAATPASRGCFQSYYTNFAARYGNCGHCVKNNRIGVAMNSLAVITMTDVLGNRFATQLHADAATSTSNKTDSHWISFCNARADCWAPLLTLGLQLHDALMLGL
jgi:hypothetical protein